MSSRNDWPSYYSDNSYADALDEAQKRYFQSGKGKEALTRYLQSEKGKKALKRAQLKYYRNKIKPGNELAKAYLRWLESHPGKSMGDFLNEQSPSSDE